MDDLELPPGEKGLVEAERVAARADHDIITRDIRQAVESCADEMVKVSGVDRNEAKIGAYWALTTHREDREVTPNLLNLGAHGTGKSQNMEILSRYCKMPSEVISAIGDSFPVVRNSVIEEIGVNCSKTIIIEEADKCLQSRKLENFIASSYSKRTSRRRLNVEQQVGWAMQEYNTWGVSFIVHRRTHLYDGANRRRGIVIRTEKREGDFPLADKVASPDADKAELVAEIQLAQLSKPQGVEGGIWDNYKMILQIASAIGDSDPSGWYGWAHERMKQDSALLTSDRDFEPSQAIFESLVTCLIPKEEYGNYKAVPLRDIADAAKRHYDMNCTNQQVSQELQAVGLTCKRYGGYYHIFPNNESLRFAAGKLGVDTDFFEEVENRREKKKEEAEAENAS